MPNTIQATGLHISALVSMPVVNVITYDKATIDTVLCRELSKARMITMKNHYGEGYSPILTNVSYTARSLIYVGDPPKEEKHLQFFVSGYAQPF